MSQDIREQAASRRQHRRHQIHSKDDDLLNLEELDLSPRSEPSPRDKKFSQDRIDDELSPRPRTGRQGKSSILENSDVFIERLIPEAFGATFTPPFVKCRCRGKEVRAMINTTSVSCISKSAAASCGLQNKMDLKLKNVEIAFGEDKKIKLDLKVENDCSDLVLGVDFLRNNLCQLDFAKSILLIDGNIRIPFLTGRDIPLKDRSTSSPASSQ